MGRTDLSSSVVRYFLFGARSRGLRAARRIFRTARRPPATSARDYLRVIDYAIFARSCFTFFFFLTTGDDDYSLRTRARYIRYANLYKQRATTSFVDPPCNAYAEYLRVTIRDSNFKEAIDYIAACIILCSYPRTTASFSEGLRGQKVTFSLHLLVISSSRRIRLIISLFIYLS